jgi:hypothetical protein
VEGVVDAAVKLIEIHGVQAILQSLVLDLRPVNCLVEQIGEGLIKHFLANILATAFGMGVAPR